MALHTGGQSFPVCSYPLPYVGVKLVYQNTLDSQVLLSKELCKETPDGFSSLSDKIRSIQ